MDLVQANLPDVMGELLELGCLKETEICSTSDGFYAATTVIADVLARRGITTVPDRQGNILECNLFFDDWYLYAVSDSGGCTYGLFKMREQEYDAKLGWNADGDTPGVTVSFIAFQTNVLLDCLRDPTPQNGKQLNEEINRVVADRGQRHSEMLKQYFVRTEAQGAYLIAKLYTGYIASLVQDGCLPVPECYASAYRRKTDNRVARFLEENNRNAGRVICDHEKLYVADPLNPTEPERLAILATHAGSASLVSFAAEVQFHAKFLTWWAKIPVSITGGSPYESAIRADMTIGSARLTGPTPYYRANSRIVKKQYECHKDNA